MFNKLPWLTLLELTMRRFNMFVGGSLKILFGTKFVPRVSILWVIGTLCFGPSAWSQVTHVVLVSFDGLRSDAIHRFENQTLPHFHQLLKEGACTLNARTDVDYTVTLPNHTCMLTGRRVTGPHGHRVLLNDIITQTVHELNGAYVDSIFDVLHRHQLTSAMAASKIKFKIYANSYPIDHVQVTDQNDAKTVQFALQQLESDHPPAFMLVHFSNPDIIGHKKGWSIQAAAFYIKAVVRLDGYLAQLMQAIQTLNDKNEPTVLIVTTDHGGTGKNHFDPNEKRNYTIPFLVWGQGIAAGKDLYTLNPKDRADPGTKQILYDASTQPIRNGDAANLALQLLGLECVPGSTIGCVPGLVVRERGK